MTPRPAPPPVGATSPPRLAPPPVGATFLSRLMPPNASAFAERITAALGIAGAIVNALVAAAASYWIWVPGNAAGLLFGMLYARRTRRWSIAAMYATYLVVSIVGLFTWSTP